MNHQTGGLQARDLHVSYGSRKVIAGLNVDITPSKITAIIGANGCGKSTLLKALANLIPHDAGRVTLDGTDVTELRRRELARRLSMLPQSPIAPDGIGVAELVARGRHPHQTWLQQWSDDDMQAVAQVLALTGISDLAERRLENLSGGQRQRAWIAMVLAQETPLILLDEPTTYLDLSHSIEVLELVRSLANELGRTVVMVLHDLNLAARYCDDLILLKDGQIVAQGTPADVLTSQLLAVVFGLDAIVIDDPVTGGPLVVPNEQKFVA